MSVDVRHVCQLWAWNCATIISLLKPQNFTAHGAHVCIIVRNLFIQQQAAGYLAGVGRPVIECTILFGNRQIA